MNHINWQSRIRNKQNLPSAPVSEYFPFLMTAVTVQAQQCSPAFQWQKSPVEMLLHSPLHVHLPVTIVARIGLQQIFGGAKAASQLHCVTQIICDLLCSIPVPHWALSLPALRAVLAVPQLQISFHQESQGEWGLLWAPAASPLQAVVLEHQS